jgi:hypothetical protein
MVLGQNTFFSKEEVEKAFTANSPSNDTEDSDSPQ